MGTLYRYLLILIACGSMLLGIQIPNFVDQYEKRLDAHLSEVKNNLQGYQEIADRLYDGSIATLIAKHEQSDDETFKQEARPIGNIVQRYEHFSKEQTALATGLTGKIANIATQGDRELINETYNNYSFTIPLNGAAVASGFIFMGMVVLVIEALRLAITRLFRPGRRKAEQPNGLCHNTRRRGRAAHLQTTSTFNHQESAPVSYQIIVHGGAYDNDSDVALRKRVCGDIVAALEKDLSRGAAALDICERAINMLEDDPLFDAGTGSYIQTDGEIRMDASLMTSDLDLGCVLQISNVKNPISVARKILENPLHCTLSGDGANQFAGEMGFASHDPKTPDTRALHDKIVRTLNGISATRISPPTTAPTPRP